MTVGKGRQGLSLWFIKGPIGGILTMSELFYSLLKFTPSTLGDGGLCLPETNPCVQGCIGGDHLVFRGLGVFLK